MPAIGPGLIQDPAKNLMFDFHQYFDGLGGGYGVCESWGGYTTHFQEITDILRAAGVQGMLTEFGGGPFRQCEKLVRRMLAFMDANSDVWHGWTAWGSFNVGSDLYLSLEQNSTFYKMTSVIKEFAPNASTTRIA